MRVLIADDHAVFRRGLKETIGEAFPKVVFGEAKTAEETLACVRQHDWELVILDISMPLLNGFESARQIKKALPGTKLIFLSQHLNPAYLKQALKIGASGYVPKTGATEELQKAIVTVLGGKIYITPAFGDDVISRLWNRSGEISNESEELTERQREILQLIVEGRANKEIADILHLSVKTIEFHRARIMMRLGVKTVAELTKVALQQGLIPG